MDVKGSTPRVGFASVSKLFIRVALLLAVQLACGGWHAGYAGALTVDRIIATINNEMILLSDYERFAHKADPDRKGDGIDDRILKNLLEERIIYLEARRQGIDAADGELDQSIREFQKQNNLSPVEFERRLAGEGMSLSDYRKLLKETIISLKLISKEVDSKVTVSDGDIARYYDENLHLFIQHPEKFQVRAIFLRMSENPSLTELTDLKIKSLKIHDELKKGRSFESLVAAYGDESLKRRDGLLGEFGKGELLPELDRAVQQMHEGETSGPLWTREGVYILNLIKTIRGTAVPIDEVRTTIYSTLYNAKRETLFNSWMTSLWSKASIEIKQQ